MRKLLSLTVLLSVSFWGAVTALQASSRAEDIPTDSVRSIELNEVKVVTSAPVFRQVNKMFDVPGSFSVITPTLLQEYSVQNICNLSSLVPNLYIPDYGSKLTSAIYLRGVGTRSSGQTVGMFIDGVPVLTKGMNRELYDLGSIDIMGGAHSSTYGRNAMAGSININTLSPMDNPGLSARLSAGTYALINGNIVYRTRLGNHWGITVGGFAHHRDGYFTNLTTHKKADQETSAGTLLKAEWRGEEGQQLIIGSNTDYVDQGAFPYGKIDKATGKSLPVNYNAPGTYKRLSTQQRIRWSRPVGKVQMEVLGGFETLNDHMHMDQDYTPADLFRITQEQQQYAATAEVIVKNRRKSRYNWTLGASVFGETNGMRVPVEICPMGLQTLLQRGLDRINASDKMPVKLQVDASESRFNNNRFRKSSLGGALFHESGFRLSDQWTLVGGLRLDLEHQSFFYDSDFAFSVWVSPKDAPDRRTGMPVKEHLKSEGTQIFFEVMPKLAVTYAPDQHTSFFASVSRGYKSGGFNEQMMTDLTMSRAQEALQAALMKQSRPEITPGDPQIAAYKPEHAINSEIGFRTRLLDDAMYLSASAFYSHITGLQITRFSASGAGRQIVNAGKSFSAGAEANMMVRLIRSLHATVSYGYTHAEFTDRMLNDNKGQEINYAGKQVPYIPQNTASLLLHFNEFVGWGALKNIHGSVEARGTGAMYWTEENDLKQPFYATLGARLGVRIHSFDVSFWARNLTDTQYNVFYFSSMGNNFLQKAAPRTFGVDLSVTL